MGLLTSNVKKRTKGRPGRGIMSGVDLFAEMKPEELTVLNGHLEPVAFRRGTCIVRQGAAGDECYLIDEGRVRLEVEQPEVDTDGVLGYLEPGAFLGELSLLDRMPRSASAYADSDIRARRLSAAALESLYARHPETGLAILRYLGRDAALKVRQSNVRLAQYIFAGEFDPEVDAMVSRASGAQREFEAWPEERVDLLLGAIAEAIAGSAEELAEETVTETGIGYAPDKVIKNRFASLDVYRMLAGKLASGPLETDEERCGAGVTEVASPVGVVFGLIPMTNPVSTLVFKTLIALKGRNALILSCHRGALGVGNRTGEMIRSVLREHGAPVDLVQWIRERGSRKKTEMFMRHGGVSLILATGGVSMVKAAYSSGTPAIGVGPGNAPAWVCADADIKEAARLVVGSKSFDFGVVCGSEHGLVVDSAVLEPFLRALRAHGAMVLTPEQLPRFTERAFHSKSGHLRRELVGQSAEHIACATGLEREDHLRLIVAPVSLDAIEGPYGREKLAPVLSLFTVDGVEEGLAACKKILSNEGLGHTAIIHTRSHELIGRFGSEISASRILVNAGGSQGCIGIGNGLMPSLTLGCGTFGGTSTTDNVSYTHLLNIKRVVHPLSSLAPAF
jgi:acetaldehyde dehydrogenase/alcohol dehydrogenase